MASIWPKGWREDDIDRLVSLLTVNPLGAGGAASEQTNLALEEARDGFIAQQRARAIDRYLWPLRGALNAESPKKLKYNDIKGTSYNRYNKTS